MPQVIRLIDDDSKPQAAGVIMRMTKNRLFAVEVNNPLRVYDLGGHRIEDTPEYSKTEASPRMEYVTLNGENQMREVYESDDFIMSEAFLIGLPDQFYAAAMAVREAQARGLNFRYFTASIEECQDACDNLAILRGNGGRLGTIDETSGVIGFDTSADNGAVITRQVRLRVSGESLYYHPLIYPAAAAHIDTVALYAIEVAPQSLCDAAGSFCPWQISLFGGGEGGVGDNPVMRRTGDKFATITNPSVSGMTAGDLITAIMTDTNGDVYVGSATDWKSGSSAGSLRKYANGAGNAISVGVTTLGIQAIAKFGSRLVAVGEAGEYHYSDDGQNWNTGTDLTSEVLTALAYNPITKRGYAVGQAGSAFEYKAGRWSEIPSLAALTTDDFQTVAVLGDDHVAVGTFDGQIYESFAASKGAPFVLTQDFGNDPVNVILGDRRSSRVLATSGAKIWERSINTKQNWVLVGEAESTINAGAVGWEEYKRGTDYFVFVTNNGSVVEVESCIPCMGA